MARLLLGTWGLLARVSQEDKQLLKGRTPADAQRSRDWQGWQGSVGYSLRARLSRRHRAALSKCPVALERDLLKYLSNTEAAHIKFLLGFYFPPHLIGSLRSLSASWSHLGVKKRNGLWSSLLFMMAPTLPQKSRCLRLVQGKSPGCMLCNCLICI